MGKKKGDQGQRMSVLALKNGIWLGKCTEAFKGRGGKKRDC